MGSTENFDLIVIGCGPAGEKAGAQAAYFGRRVAIIERAEHMGGSCINSGTVPSKTLRESALYFSGLKQRGPVRNRLLVERKPYRALHARTNSVSLRCCQWGVYTIPEISAAGETEESCKEKKIDYVVGRALYENNARGHITGDTAGMLKLIFARADKKLLGVSMIGENATELIHIGLTVLDKGLKIDEFIEQVFNYPTLSETYKYAAYDGLGTLAGHKLREG